ncbi:bifunctional demethylmenaquinone methyltransferase/2-methoxy-6-polyprenyl-1,4-benzoquinol methylase UbiE [Synechocystis sp. LKSZ1]|uniref:bifunctional demethylmenaquinone methyltransferase/2-methoxy-6-polyprenyl-1,4-benzoquinol methylase UbiE n=1 Tax=Synechocystis sp. LKSZ1 TaxID=3144951 RepID=UPI00336BBE7B
MPAVSPPTPTEVEALFGRIAPVYDSFNFWLSLGQHQVWKAMTVGWSACQQGDQVLDVCCGTGDLTQRLAKQVGLSGQVVGLDFCSELLALAAQRHRQTYPQYSVQWLQGDALALPFADQSFDGATMGYGLRNVGDIPQALTELQRVLKVGKKVAILDFNHPRAPWMQRFQDWYLNQIVLAVAGYFRVPEEYAYIQASLDRFPPGQEQVKMAYNAGFSRVVHYEIAGGLMGVLVAQK